MTGGKSCVVCKVVGILVALGGINWGLYGFFNMNLVANIFGSRTMPAMVVYALIGVAGLMKVVWLFGCCPCQKHECAPTK